MAEQLVTVPSTKAYHLPPGGSPVLLAEGDLVLSRIPAHAPDHPKETITLSVGTASFPITHATPVVKVDTNGEHPAFAFRPTVGGERAGKVKVTLKESTGPAEYERTEAMALALEKQLKELGCWKEMGYYDIEDEQDAVLAASGASAQGYGTTIADTLTSYGKWLAHRIETFTESVNGQTPAGQATVPEGLKTAAGTSKSGTERAAGVTHGVTESIGEVVHDGAAYLGQLAQGAVKSLQDAMAGPTTDKVADSELGRGASEVASNVGAAAGETWEEVKLGAEGAATGAKEVSDAVAESTYKTIDHSYGSEASKVARDVGATGSNAAGVAVDATLVSSVYKHGYDAGAGAVDGYQAGADGKK